MFIGLSFIGTLPSYIIHCIHQIRCFFDGNIYLIINDTDSIYIDKLMNYNINIISYNLVRDSRFDNIITGSYNKFKYVNMLYGREELFLRSIERFFLMNNLINIENLEDCIFLEIDNLIYNDPRKWIEQFSQKELAYLYENINRCSSSIMYIKNKNSLGPLLDYLIDYINISNEDDWINEMTGLYNFYLDNKDYIQILPNFFERDDVIDICTNNYNKFDSIFDATNIGIFLLGMDPYHTKWEIKKGLHGTWGIINYTKEKFDWKIDNSGRKIPYILDDSKWIRINNLHVHSKNLVDGLSMPIN